MAAQQVAVYSGWFATVIFTGDPAAPVTDREVLSAKATALEKAIAFLSERKAEIDAAMTAKPEEREIVPEAPAG